MHKISVYIFEHVCIKLYYDQNPDSADTTVPFLKMLDQEIIYYHCQALVTGHGE